MKLKTKLSYGLGFLFAIIFALVFFCSYYVQTLAADSKAILKDNYVSVVYARNMATALNDMQSNATPSVFDAAKAEFERNLSLERNNITEPHERDYVEALSNDYRMFIGHRDQLFMDGCENRSTKSPK